MMTFLARVLELSVRHRWLVLALTAAIAVFGAFQFTRLPIDAVPDITNVQLQINTEASGFTPLEVEQRITFPVETAMAGLPALDYTRSISRYGLSQVTVVFEDGTDIYFARQLVNERIQSVRNQLPPDLVPTMGPIATKTAPSVAVNAVTTTTSRRSTSATRSTTCCAWPTRSTSSATCWSTSRTRTSR